MDHFIEPPPLSLYVHLPWCVKKCPYCDFNSHPLRESIPEDAYIDALIRDLDHDLPLLKNRAIHSIFFGGGTPSLFSGAAIARLLNHIRSQLTLTQDCEITLEANPGTVEQQRFYDYRQAGVNRLSIGIQSFNNEHLKRLGRIHGGDEAERAIAIARQAGFTNINLDLMHGLPEQTLEQALTDLSTAIDFSPPHLSWYQLTLEPNTLFYQQPPALPDDDHLWEIQQAGLRLLSAAGFDHYEVSAHCQPDQFSRHNLNYWEFGDYLGIGAGAHSKITDSETQTIWRFSKLKHPKAYLSPNESFIAEKQAIDTDNRRFEFMLNALRLNRPLSFALFTRRTGLAQDTLSVPLNIGQDKGWLTINEKGFTLTPSGRNFLNDVVSLFMPVLQ